MEQMYQKFSNLGSLRIKKKLIGFSCVLSAECNETRN